MRSFWRRKQPAGNAGYLHQALFKSRRFIVGTESTPELTVIWMNVPAMAGTTDVSAEREVAETFSFHAKLKLFNALHDTFL